MIFIVISPGQGLPSFTQPAGGVALAGLGRMLDAQLHVGRQRGQAQHQEEHAVKAHFMRQARAASRRVGAGKPAPLEGQAVQADAAVQFHRKQQHQVQRPHHARPDAVGAARRGRWSRAA
jgi:hypothetical protein